MGDANVGQRAARRIGVLSGRIGIEWACVRVGWGGSFVRSEIFYNPAMSKDSVGVVVDTDGRRGVTASGRQNQQVMDMISRDAGSEHDKPT